MIKRLVRLATLLVLVAGTFAEAQQAGKVPRIGYLAGANLSGVSARVEGFRQGLRELGYLEGKNIAIEWRFADGKLDRLAGLAAELVHLKVDIIVSGGADVTLVVKQPLPSLLS